MLVVARKSGQSILIGDDIEVVVIGIRGDQVRLAIKAPRSLIIQRRDALEEVQQDNLAALTAADDVFRLMGNSTSDSPQKTGTGPRVVTKPRPPSTR
ncbi:carbon storage regulator [Armatimonas sp.]|uniref:carbon storage regulator n=1 Tax=Armatimonas sp. TaxID=1872638 RepID=UPI00286B23CD|nr:carbon storage regulator [Armatimonas sp.]